MSGWIKLHRSITDHWLYTEKRVYSRFEAWNDILLTVNYSDAKTIIKGKMYTIKRGESILSLESWAKRWNWDKSKVRRFFSLLQTDAMIVVKGDSITTHLIVCKYDSYQGDRHADETQKKHKRNADDIQTTPIEEEEEYKKNKEEKEILFERFWDLYDKKVGDKDKIKSKFDNLKGSEIELIFIHIPKYKIARPDKKYRKDPSAYLNQKSWNDEIIGAGNIPNNEPHWKSFAR
jgi:hypothetical protein